MVSRGTGGIINLASNAAFQPLPHMATYAAAKAFVLHFSEALEFELKGRGVQVMAVCPGPTATSFLEGVSIKMKGGAFDSAELVVRRTLRAFDQKKSVAYPNLANSCRALAFRLGFASLMPLFLALPGIWLGEVDLLSGARPVILALALWSPRELRGARSMQRVVSPLSGEIADIVL
jgi:short-subunit dehydrogenase